MDPTTAGEQTAGSRATSSDPGHRAGLSKEAELLWCELRGLAHDHLQLAALETQRAGESLVTMITAGMIVAGLLLSAWLGLVGAAVLALTGSGVIANDSALLDGDGFHEVHINTMEGFWSLLRSWLRPHRGISQEKLPIYLGFFEFVHNVRRRGRALLGSLLDTLLQPVACPQNPI